MGTCSVISCIHLNAFDHEAEGLGQPIKERELAERPTLLDICLAACELTRAVCLSRV